MKKNASLIITSLLALSLISLIVLKIEINRTNDEIFEKEYIGNFEDTITKTETEKEITYEIIDDKLTYSWTFNKDEKLKQALKDNMEIDMDLKLSILPNIQNQKLNNMVDNKDLLVIKFNHHGSLPTKAKISLDVSNKYQNGETLYLYYLNEEKDQIEYIDSGIKVKNGKVEFTIEHCSDYFLTGSIVQDAVNNPKNINLIIIVMVIVIIVLIASTLFQNKK